MKKSSDMHLKCPDCKKFMKIIRPKTKTTASILKCEYCDKELKSNAGKVAHERSCKARDIGGQTEEEIATVENEETTSTKETRVVQLEVVGESNYYVGHPRRETKLRGLLSRTFDKDERSKIYSMILEIMDENK